MRRTLLAVGWLCLAVNVCGILGHLVFPVPHPDLRAAISEHPVSVILYAALYGSPALLALFFGVVALKRYGDAHGKRLAAASAVVFVGSRSCAIGTSE